MATRSNDILSVLQQVCQAYPEHAAVVEGDDAVLTYGQLWHQAQCVAEYVKSNGGASPFVGLNQKKSASYIVSMIGCWLAGKAFVPIGTDLPPARQKFIREHADIKLCLDKDTFREALTSVCNPTENLALDLGRFACKELRTESCSTERSTLVALLAKNCEQRRAAYMIYSSGTTGTPKGILVGHAGLCNLASCQQRAFGVDCHSRYLFFLSVNFDASISDILVTLTSGATLVIEPMPQEELALKLFDVVEKRGVTHTDIPPSLLKMLEPDQCPACLQTIVIGGEPADIATVRRWSALSLPSLREGQGWVGGGFRLVNVYGPTEATVCTSMCQCDAEWDAPLLGDVLDATHYHIYADDRLDASDGELWISGIGLALGYYKDEELTRRKFPVIDGVRYYRTSDHVRKDDRQRLVFVGRMDRQVKFHGQLIELEEIENRLRTNRHVRTVAVVKRSPPRPSERGLGGEVGKEAIVAFVQLVDDSISQADVERQLRQCCKHHLPRWMMPSFFEFIERMPLTPSGKTDLQALSAVALSKTVNEACCQYASKEEEAIARVMADILKLPTMSPDDDFLLCGGDSLDTIILISRLQQMGIVVTSEQLRQASTPRLLAQKVLPKPCRRLPPRPSGRLRGGELRSGWRGLGSEALRDSQVSALSSHNSSMCIHSSQLESQWQYPTSPPPSGAQGTSHLSPRSSCSVNCGTAAVPITPQFFASKATKVERSVGLFLVTGATGFLGSHLLSELLGRGQPVLCLVRCSSAARGLERVTDSFRRFGLDTHLLQGIGIIAGDITLPRLGLSADDYRQLSEKVTDVVHCAATVNMLANYDVLKETNVTGTRRILDFCTSLPSGKATGRRVSGNGAGVGGRRKKLHYASTLSVFVATDRNSDTVFESDELNVPTNIYGGYGQTKFVAEKMAMGISPACCDKFIYRFGLLCGDTLRGLSAPKDFLGMFFRGAKAVGTLPYDETNAMAVDITPIDQASRIVADIIASGKPGVYHIAAENPLNYNHLCMLMKEEGIIRDIVDDDQWQKSISAFGDNADVQALRMALCRMDATLFRQMRYMDLFQTTGIRFDMTNTHAATPQRCKQDNELIKLYISNFCQTPFPRRQS